MKVWESPSDDENDGEGWKGKSHTKRFTENLKEEGQRAARKERWQRAEAGFDRAKELLEQSGLQYSFGMVFWEKQSGDGPFLVIFLFGSVAIHDRRGFIPRELISRIIQQIKGIYLSKGEYVHFLPESGLFVTSEDAGEITEGLGQPLFKMTIHKKKPKSQYGRK